MNQSQIREIVNITLDELIQRKMLKDPYHNILRILDKRLYNYFNGCKDSEIKSVLHELSDDPYIDIIYLQYRDHKTIEWIAEYYNKDTSTIKRNKKRLINKIYELVT